ncbi:MAG TPA: J domain-containing protein [Xanthobacteraceae bacterium]|jgi:DnaJ-class molecular chaperone|nr:J domain-containing protein [Xanthobacteraceae bacterium]
MRDPYDVLGVQKSASEGDIKSAFRRMAKKLHPDANRQDPKAATRFAELNAAYEIVGDKDKRKAFDNGEIDAEGKPRFQGFGGGGAGRGGRTAGGGFEGFNWGSGGGFQRGGGAGAGAGGFEDILRDVFGRSGARRSSRQHQFEPDDFGMAMQDADINAALTITLAEAVNGDSTRLRLPTGKDVDVKIPAGLSDGQQIRLKGQGHILPNGRAGDLLITVSVAPHPIFKVEGRDLRIELPITLYEAVLGAKIRVPLLSGAIELAIPPNTSGGRTFRLKGKGLKQKAGTGDLLATVRIVMPDKRDDELEALMTKWRDGKPYNPRSDF